jgi:hypothetical protein
MIIKKTTKIFHLLSHMSVADTQFALTANVLRAQFSLNFDTLFFSSQCRVIFANTIISLRASLHTRVNSRKGHTQLTSICHGGKRPKRTCHCHWTRSISRSAHHSILVYMESGMAEQSRRNSSVLARELLLGLFHQAILFAVIASAIGSKRPSRTHRSCQRVGDSGVWSVWSRPLVGSFSPCAQYQRSLHAFVAAVQ